MPRLSQQSVSLHLEGGLFPIDLIERLKEGDLPSQQPADFGQSSPVALSDEIAAVWNVACAHWEHFQRRLNQPSLGNTVTSITRELWVGPLLRLLGYHNLAFQRRARRVGNLTFAISHLDGDLPVHIEGCSTDLDRRPPSGHLRLSPHALLQEYLNRTEALWGIVTNGYRLRLLRDNALMTRPAYVKFDLQSIFAGERFADFILFYRLVHRSRLPSTNAEASYCWLEQYYQMALEQGGRVREKLREGVEDALQVLGRGFLRHPQNHDLRRAVQEGRVTPENFYRYLLRLVYRLLFLMVSGERGLIGPKNPRLAAIYQQTYSVTRLRRLAQRPLPQAHRHADLWHGLLVTFRLFEDEERAARLDMHALDGDLFAPNALGSLNQALLSNADLLAAMRRLSLYHDGHALRWINYAALDVEELGSVYESLLELQPLFLVDRDPPEFAFAQGIQRKTTGSYYTRLELVQELVASALDPVVRARLRGLSSPQEKERALLSIKVIDPAAGSGHFLLAAARYLGRELAWIRTGEEYPPFATFRAAVREVIRHCIYGVDKNPLAVELCKVALWLESQNQGKPLTFLDHRIRVGDSLVGVFDLGVLVEGLPKGAFNPVSGDDKRIARKIKANNQLERSGQLTFYDKAGLPDIQDLARRWRELEAQPDADVAAIRQKARTYAKLHSHHTAWWILWTACNLWTAAFFQRYPQPDGTPPITTATVRAYLNQPQAADGRVGGFANSLAAREHFFHWPLEFPEVFANGGFDVVLGTPPWERIKLQEKEFFATPDPEIASAPNAALRKRLIQQLLQKNPGLWHEYQEALHTAESTSRFLRESGFYPLTGRGDINTYSVFAERMRALLKPDSRAGIIVPTGIATDDTNKYFFADLVDSGNLVRLYDFENREGIFPHVHRSYKFSLVAMKGRASGKRRTAHEAPAPMTFVFFATRTEHLRDPRRCFTLTPEDIARINPNTRTLPVFRTRQGADLTRAIYARVPVLVNEQTDENPWGVRFLRMLDMSNDSHLFRTREELRAQGYRLVGNVFHRDSQRYLPLYEAKFIDYFDHRFGSYETRVAERGYRVLPKTPVEKYKYQDLTSLVQPWYWVPEKEVIARLQEWKHKWLLGFRNVTSATNERTAVFSLLPLAGVGHSMPLLFAENATMPLVSCLLGSLSSLAFDYFVRQKLGGVNMTFGYIRQFPVLPPAAYTPADLAFIVPRVLKLTYTAWDLAPFAADVWHDADDALRAAIHAQWEANAAIPGDVDPAPPDWLPLLGIAPDTAPFPPFKWDSERRARLQAELDAYYARLYGLTRKQLRYILDPADLTARELEDILDPWEEVADPLDPDGYAARVQASDFPGETFRVLKEKEIRQYGEYRTRRLVLEAWARLAAGAPSPLLSAGTDPMVTTPSTAPAVAPRPWGAVREGASVPPAAKEASLDETIREGKAKPSTAPGSGTPAQAAQGLADDGRYALFRCRACGKLVLGFDCENHRRTLHPGEAVRFEPVGMRK